MKKMLLLFAFMAGAFYSIAQNGAFNERKAYLRNQGYSILDEFYDDLKEGYTTYRYRNFYASGSYIIFAMSEDTDVEDIDLYVYETNGDEYVSDYSVRRMAAVDINVLVSREMKIVVKNYKSRTPYYASRCRFLIAYK
jgi:hypothetical protein